MVSCGIHSGVASTFCEMSLNVYEPHTSLAAKYAKYADNSVATARQRTSIQ